MDKTRCNWKAVFVYHLFVCLFVVCHCMSTICMCKEFNVLPLLGAYRNSYSAVKIQIRVFHLVMQITY